MIWVEVALRWYGVLLLSTWAFAPMVRWLCTALDDRGASIVRPLALLAMPYPAWLLASLQLLQFGTIPVLATVAMVGLAGWSGLIRARAVPRHWLRALVITEAASLLLFLAYLALRGFTPDILGTEKPMDVALLASSARTESLPPMDPWFAGQPINYYYLGYLLFGTIGRLAGVAPATAFNLALGTVFSVTVVAAGGLAWNVVRPKFGALSAAVSAAAAGFFLAIAGNLYAVQRLLQNANETIGAWWWDSAVGIGWRSSRIVCDGPRVGNRCLSPAIETINEFPYFSFLLGDLHPHVMTLPYTVVSMTLIWNVFRYKLADGAATQGWWLRIALTGAAIGALYPLNAWDLPIYLLLALVAVGAAAARNDRRSWEAVLLLIASAVIPWLPFVRSYAPPSLPLESAPNWFAHVPVLPRVAALVDLYTGERTSLAEYLTMFGVPYAFGVALLAVSLRRAKELELVASRTVLISLFGIALLGVVLSAPVLVLCGVPALLAIALLVRHHPPEPETFALAVLVAAWGLSMLVEIVYVRDLFDSRMNSLFKFYYQSWTLYALALAVSLPVLWRAALPARAWRVVIVVATAVAVILGLSYPVVATYQWTGKFAQWQGLDGLAYGETLSPDDVAAINWLAANAAAGDVLLEAAGCSYAPQGRLPFDRVSAFTGIPTVIGWDGHERQWRAGKREDLADIAQRQRDVATMFANPQSRLFDEYGVDWLVVGEFESGDLQADCPHAGPYPAVKQPGYPGPGWTEAFSSGTTRIYRRTVEE